MISDKSGYGPVLYWTKYVSIKTLEACEGSKKDFRDWLNTRIPNLGNNKPVELLKTESGRFAVQEAIGRIEFNVYG